MKHICFFSVLIIFFFSSGISVKAISAEYACVMEPVTNKVCYEKNMHTKAPMASTTKIMTALLAIEKGSLEDIVTVSANAARQEGSSIYLRAGNKILMRDLLYGLMLNSGNDAAVAVAEHISGDVQTFAQLMTQKAREIGAKDTCFQNPNGLEAPEHYTTAYDLALIASYAMKNSDFREIVSTKTAQASLQNESSVLYFKNHNKLLTLYPDAIGVKTGFTKAAGRCLVSAAERDGIDLICVTLKAPDDWNDHQKLLNECFSKMELRTVLRKDDILKEKEINGQKLELLAGKDVLLPIEKDNVYHAEVSLRIPSNVSAPLNQGEPVGKAEILCNGKLVDVIDVLSGDEVDERRGGSLGGCCRRVFRALL